MISDVSEAMNNTITIFYLDSRLQTWKLDPTGEILRKL